MLKYDLQTFGGRGAGSGNVVAAAPKYSATSVLNDSKSEDIDNEKRNGYWRYEHREAAEVPNEPGILKLTFPNYSSYTQASRTTLAASSKITHGFINTSAKNINGRWIGVNWNNVKEVRGETYALRNELKGMGFRWDGKSKSWKK